MKILVSLLTSSQLAANVFHVEHKRSKVPAREYYRHVEG